MALPGQGQKSISPAKLLVEGVCPLSSDPEYLLSDRSTNMLSYLMNSVCRVLGIHKVKSTAYHPQYSRQNRQYRQIAGWGSQVPVEGRKTAYTAGCSGH